MNNRLITILSFLVIFFVPAIALAAAAPAGGGQAGLFALAKGLGMGIAVIGGGIGQGRAAAAALEGICRNPNAADKVFTPMLLGLAFVESLVIFVFVTTLIM